MRSIRKSRLRNELERVQEENRSLNEQMQRLIRTERRLSISRHQLDIQFRRMEALNLFSLEASRTNQVTRILELGLEMLFSTFPFEQALAFLKDENGDFAPAAVHSVRGREPQGSLTEARAPSADGLPKDLKFGCVSELTGHAPSLRGFLKALEALFPPNEPEEREPARAAVLALPIYPRIEEGMQALLLLRRLTPGLSLLERLPAREDYPFLRLLCAHLASAMENLMLYHEIRLSEQEARSRAIENERLYREAREAIQGRDEFLSLASHELRTPITPLKNGLDLITLLVKRGQLATYPQERLEKLVQIADRELIRLSRLIDGMLEVTRISSGRLRLNLERVEFGALIREMVERLGTEAQRTGSRVQLDLQDTEPGLWDRLRIEQVVTNLLTNAFKYGQGKPITLSSRTEGDQAVLRVQDAGIGIAPEDQKKIFQRFERAVTELQAGGLGLGLYLTRQILESHHGTITVSSELGRGSTFTVRIPLKAPRQDEGKAA